MQQEEGEHDYHGAIFTQINYRRPNVSYYRSNCNLHPALPKLPAEMGQSLISKDAYHDCHAKHEIVTSNNILSYKMYALLSKETYIDCCRNIDYLRISINRIITTS
jgi:hypothetical protein